MCKIFTENSIPSIKNEGKTLGVMTTSNALEIKMVIGKAFRSGFQMLLVICGHVQRCGEKMKPGDGGVQRAQGESGGGPAFGL